MKTFLKGIRNMCTDVFGDLDGGIHWGLARLDGPVFKEYLVLNPEGGDEPEENTGAETVETRGMRFQFYGAGLARVTDLVDTAYALFRKLSLTLEDGNRVLSGIKVSDDFFLDPDRANDGTEIWVGILGMEFPVQRTV